MLELLKSKVAEVSKVKNEHRSLLTLPRDIAGMVSRDEGVVNKSIEAFCGGWGSGDRKRNKKIKVSW